MQVKRNADVLKSNLSFAGKRVLDIGAGEGHLTRLMAKEGATVIGLECSPGQLKKAMSYDVVAGERFIDAVAQSLPFEDESFDIVVFFNSLHHVPIEDQYLAITEATRVLVPNGMLYISEPIAEGSHSELLKPIDDETLVRQKAYDVIKRYEEFGLKWVEEDIYNHPVRRESFEELREKLIGPNPEREKIFANQDKSLRDAFDRLGTKKSDGFTYFDQPTRMNLLQKIG
jgi:ubiquinone/menaquinone biosynthesis C-methylase UbiE